MLEANIAPPQAYITEIQVDSSGSWTIELGFHEMSMLFIDSMRLETSSGSAQILQLNYLPGYTIYYYDSLALVTNANLSNSLTIDLSCDYVKLYSYAFTGNLVVSVDSVVFGSYPGSFLSQVSPAQSMAEVGFMQGPGWCGSFCLDNSPTLGLPNDTAGSLSTLFGMVYSIDGNPFTEGSFLFDRGNFFIYIQPDGSFSQRIFACDYYEDTINIYFPPWPYTTVSYVIDPVEVSFQPDTAIQRDFITISIVAFTPESEKQKPKPVAFPNPFTDRITFYLPLQNHPVDEQRLRIYSQGGKLVFDQVADPEDEMIIWSPASPVPSGSYLYQFGSVSAGFTGGTIIRLNH